MPRTTTYSVAHDGVHLPYVGSHNSRLRYTSLTLTGIPYLSLPLLKPVPGPQLIVSLKPVSPACHILAFFRAAQDYVSGSHPYRFPSMCPFHYHAGFPHAYTARGAVHTRPISIKRVSHDYARCHFGVRISSAKSSTRLP